LALAGCPGELDPALLKMASGSGGSSATGGSQGTGGSPGTGGSQQQGTGGSNPTGGSPGTGGTSTNCTGGNDGATMVTASATNGGTCAVTDCHDSSGAQFSGGLDLSAGSGLSARLVDVMSQGTVANGSVCMSSTEPYLKGGSNPATGLLIDKVKSTVPCGQRMPYAGIALTTTQQMCLVQWATTLTSP
jgi:hypothetical protein